jgi:hypothetical protein
MRLFKTLSFTKDADAQELTDGSLKEAIKEVRNGLIDARLGGSVIKKQIAIGSKGKRGGLRSLLVHRSPNDNVFCIYLFAKNETENTSNIQLKQLKSIATTLLGLQEADIQKALKAGELIEVITDEPKE